MPGGEGLVGCVPRFQHRVRRTGEVVLHLVIIIMFLVLITIMPILKKLTTTSSGRSVKVSLSQYDYLLNPHLSAQPFTLRARLVRVLQVLVRLSLPRRWFGAFHLHIGPFFSQNLIENKFFVLLPAALSRRAAGCPCCCCGCCGTWGLSWSSWQR